MSDLNIDVICANTPAAKGRVERAHQTLQDRLVKELRLRRISTMQDANRLCLLKTSSTADRSEAQNQTSKADERGPRILGSAIAPVDRLATHPNPREARDRGPLAP
jgi:hypothetical protein